MRSKVEPHNPPTLRAYIEQVDLCTEELRKEYEDILKRQPRPDVMCGKVIPHDLNMITYGQLYDIREAVSEDGIKSVFAIAEVLLGEPVSLFEEDVNIVFGFINFCTSEIERINKLFEGISPEYSSEERQAGVEQLNFGSFGIMDWYAKRMGITDQNDVRDVAWVRIFTCMKNDMEQQQYERRLQEVFMHKSSHK